MLANYMFITGKTIFVMRRRQHRRIHCAFSKTIMRIVFSYGRFPLPPMWNLKNVFENKMSLWWQGPLDLLKIKLFSVFLFTFSLQRFSVSSVKFKKLNDQNRK